LSKTLKCPKKHIILQSGEKSRLKTLILPLIYKEKLEDLINAAVTKPG
jgi:uncharacterized protein YggU (UPF0235/DUF167 family)